MLPKSPVAGAGGGILCRRELPPPDKAVWNKEVTGGAMGQGYGAQGMVGPLRRVVMRRPGEAMAAADPAAWHYTGAIDVEEACGAHEVLAEALRAWGVEVLYHDKPLPDHSDSVFVFDPVLVTDRGTLVLSMGKERRRGEEEPLARALQDCGVPVSDASRATPASRAATPCGSITTRWRSVAASAPTLRAFASSAATSSRSV